MLRWMKRTAWIAGLGIIGTAIFFTIPVSRPDDAGTAFDIQVVLGGNTRERSEVCLALWRKHPTPILVTGDLDYIRDALLRLEIPASSIIHEPKARSTWENAELSIHILKEHKVKRAVIVTSWFHTKRAYGCFTALGHGIRFSTCSDPEPASYSMDNWKVTVIERAKGLGYWLSKALNPWRAGK